MDDFKHQFPKVPEGFHNRVEETLNQISQEKTSRNFSKKALCVLIAAIVLALGGITAIASGLFTWDDKMIELFGADKEQQQKLIEKGVTQKENVFAIDNGLTIKLVQTLQDKKYMYILLEVTAPQNIKLSGDNLFEDMGIDLSGGRISCSGGFIAGSDSSVSNKGYFQYWINKKSHTDMNNTDINLHFKNLQYNTGKLNMKTILEGEWNLSWKSVFKDSTQYFDLNKRFNLSGYDVLVKKVELSPLSMTIYFDGKDLKSMEKAEGVKLDKLDMLEPINFKGIKNKDGNKINIISGQGEGGFEQATGDYMVSLSFDKLIDTENVEGLLFGNEYSEVVLVK